MQLKPHITHNKLLYLLRIFTHLCIISLWWIKFCPSKCPFLSAFQHEAHKSLLTPPWMTYNLRQLEVLKEPLWQLGTGTNVKFTIYVYIYIYIYTYCNLIYKRIMSDMKSYGVCVWHHIKAHHWRTKSNLHLHPTNNHMQESLIVMKLHQIKDI